MNITDNLTEVFHELKNPISTIKINIDLMKTKPNSFEKNIDVIDNELSKINNILNCFLNFNSTKELTKDIIYFNDVIKTIINENKLTYPNISFNIIYESDISILAFEYHIYMIFSNIIKNSIEAISGYGEINIRISENEGIGLIEIVDTGCGISASTIQKLSKGKYTTKKQGTGLGTIIIKNILDIYNGDFHLITQDKGAKAIVTIPLE